MQTVQLSAADVAALQYAYYREDLIPAYDPVAEATVYAQQAADPATVAQAAGSAEFWEQMNQAQPNPETDAERAARAAVLAAQSQRR